MAESKTLVQPTETSDARRVVVRKDKTNPRRAAYVALLLFATEPSLPLLLTGTLLAVAGILFHGWAAGYLARAGYAEREPVLTVRGPYRHNRNPYYVAHLVMDFGFFCMAGLPALYLLYFPISFSVYRRWVVKEEPFLEKEFGKDYREFKAAVPRWAVRLLPAAPMGPEQKFDWTIFRLNREAHRAISHIAFIGVLLAFAQLGNPMAAANPLVLITIFAAFIVRLVMVDIEALDKPGISLTWMLAAGAVMAAVGMFLSLAPVWDPWPPMPSWLFGGTGALMGLFVGISLLPKAHLMLGRPLHRLFTRPEYHWYLLGLGLGLLSGTLGGVWLGLLLPVILWMGKIAGIVPSLRLSRQNSTGFAVLLIFAVSIIAAMV